MKEINKIIMKKKIIIVFCLLITFFTIGKIVSKNDFSILKNNDTKLETEFKDGDIILQTSQSQQCEAVRIATNSKFSHCGIIFKENGKLFVYEAVQPVKMTPLEDWIQHGKDNKYLVMRLKNAATLLNDKTLKNMKTYGLKFLNKDYDLYFEWSDNKIYCSELVWKIYKNGANIELCNLEKLKDFNLENPKVKEILKERYGNDIPLNEDVVAPSQLANSNKLEVIFDNY